MHPTNITLATTNINMNILCIVLKDSPVNPHSQHLYPGDRCNQENDDRLVDQVNNEGMPS